MNKILILSDINSAHTQKWVSAMIKHGYQVMLFSFTDPISDWYKSYSNFSFLSLGYNKKGKAFSLFAKTKLTYFKSLPILKKCVKDFQPDIIHSHYASSYGLMGSLLKFSPYYVSVWGSDVFEFPKRSSLTKRILKRVFKTADKIFSSSRIMAKEIELYTDKKAIVIPFGVDTTIFIPKNKEKSNIITLGFIKSIEKIYGIDILVKAFSIAYKQTNKLHLRIVGDGSLKTEIEQLISDLNLKDAVTLVGRVPYNQIASEYQKLDLFINPSRFESFGVSVLEASSSGIPVIASNVGGLKEVVENSKTGVLVDPENTQELANAILEFASDEDLRLKLGQNGRQYVLDNYSLEYSVDCLHKERS